MGILEAIMYGLDTPGAYARGLLSGRGFERTSGREFLQSYGMENPGWLSSLAAELVVDPLNWIPASWLGRLFKLRKAAEATNALRAERLAAGAMPEELLKLSKAVNPETGKPLMLYRGTHDVTIPWEKFRASPENLFVGDTGAFFTDSPHVADSYVDVALTRHRKMRAPGVQLRFMAARNPYTIDYGGKTYRQTFEQPNFGALMDELIRGSGKSSVYGKRKVPSILPRLIDEEEYAGLLRSAYDVVREKAGWMPINDVLPSAELLKNLGRTERRFTPLDVFSSTIPHPDSYFMVPRGVEFRPRNYGEIARQEFIRRLTGPGPESAEVLEAFQQPIDRVGSAIQEAVGNIPPEIRYISKSVPSPKLRTFLDRLAELSNAPKVVPPDAAGEELLKGLLQTGEWASGVGDVFNIRYGDVLGSYGDLIKRHPKFAKSIDDAWTAAMDYLIDAPPTEAGGILSELGSQFSLGRIPREAATGIPPVRGAIPADTALYILNQSFGGIVPQSVTPRTVSGLALKKLGHDSVRHVGGSYLGRGKLHDVWVSLDWNNIFNPQVAPAAKKLPNPAIDAILESLLFGYNIPRFATAQYRYDPNTTLAESLLGP